MCDFPLPTSYDQVVQFGTQAGFLYLISAEACHNYFQATTESYEAMLARKNAASNPFDVEIPADYE